MLISPTLWASPAQTVGPVGMGCVDSSVAANQKIALNEMWGRAPSPEPGLEMAT